MFWNFIGIGWDNYISSIVPFLEFPVEAKLRYARELLLVLTVFFYVYRIFLVHPRVRLTQVSLFIADYVVFMASSSNTFQCTLDCWQCKVARKRSVRVSSNIKTRGGVLRVARTISHSLEDWRPDTIVKSVVTSQCSQ